MAKECCSNVWPRICSSCHCIMSHANIFYAAGDVTASVTEGCKDLIVTWSPVDSARQYTVQLQENDVDIMTTTVTDNMYKTSLSNDSVKDKTLTLKVMYITKHGSTYPHVYMAVDK